MNCRKHVGTGAVTFSCTVPIPDGMAEHPGPCEAVELPASQAARRRWQEAEAQRQTEAEQARATLAETQSQPMTFAAANPSHTASAVPGSGLSPEAHRAAFQPKVGEFGVQGPGVACEHPFDFLMEEPDGALVCRKCVTVVKEPTGAPAPAPATPAAPTAEEAMRADTAAVQARAEATMAAIPRPAPRSVGTPIAMPPGLREATVTEVAPESTPKAYTESPTQASVQAIYDAVDATVAEALEPSPSFQGDPGVPVEETPATLEDHLAAEHDNGMHIALADERCIACQDQASATQAVPTKQRPGDQPLPTSDPDAPCVQDAIIEMMEESKAIGIERYGQTLHIFNGRDTLLDAHEEARDGLVYLTALKLERAEVLKRFERVAAAMVQERRVEDLMDDVDFILAWLRGEPTP